MKTNKNTRVTLFVYGTLLKGFGNHKHLMRNATFVGEGTTKGRMYALGISGTFPGAKFEEDGTIRGEVYEVTKPELKDIDALEGHHDNRKDLSLYYRRPVLVQMADGTAREALSYEYQPDCDKRRPISSGDFRVYVKEHK